MRRRPSATSAVHALALLVLLSIVACAGARESTVQPARSYESIAAELVRCIEHEREAKGIPAMAIALVDADAPGGESLVWATGFGSADAGVSADARTVWRVGSVSKLFTDMALMQLVEDGIVALDDPVTRLLPGFGPSTTQDGPITFRQLTSHRSGLVREPPVGNYFDDSEPSLEATVASLAGLALVHAPGEVTKYSNAGIAVIGRALEVHYGQPYAALMREHVLLPMGLMTAAFEATPGARRRLAKARMWAYDGREFDAPTFALGMAPAGSLYASVTDLATFLDVLFAGGESEYGPVLRPETLEAMLRPAAGPDGAPTRFGVGFTIDELDGRRRCGHGGAIYGFSTELAFLPEERLGVVVTSSMDVTNTVTRRIADHALRLLLARREQRQVARLSLGKPLPAGFARAFAGRYANADDEAEIVARADGRTWLEWNGVRAQLRVHGKLVRVDDRHAFGTEVRLVSGGVAINGREYERQPDELPAPALERHAELVGEYGPDHNVLFVRERSGRLEALIEWIFFDELEEIGRGVFNLPANKGLYPGERLVFERDATDRVVAARLGPVRFPRRETGTEGGQPFTIEPRYDEAELRARALRASPPVEDGQFLEPDLVDLERAVPGIALDVRYATRNNFLRTVFYPEARAFLQRPAAAALSSAQANLAAHGLGLVAFDAYRPWHVTKMFWDATPDALRHFVADPSAGSRHNRGCAVDVGLIDLATGAVQPTPGDYDEFSERSYPDYPGGTSRQRWMRERLRSAMEAAGFSIYRWEWWHFDFEGWRRYPILDLEFDEVEGF